MNIIYVKPDGGSTLGVSKLLSLRPRHKFGTVCPAATKHNILSAAVGHRGSDLTSFWVIVGHKVTWLWVKTNLAL